MKILIFTIFLSFGICITALDADILVNLAYAHSKFLSFMFLSLTSDILSNRRFFPAGLSRDMRIIYPEWNAGNKSQACFWRGVTCDGDQNVIAIDLCVNFFGAKQASQCQTLPFLAFLRLLNQYFSYICYATFSTRLSTARNPTVCNGTIPAYVSGLQRLRSLMMVNNDIVGELPAELWSLPDLDTLYLATTGITIRMPRQFPRKLRNLRFDDTRIIGTIPDGLDWDTLGIFDFTHSAVNCPLPQSLIDFWNAGKRLASCRMSSNYFWVDQGNMLCGQIPIQKSTCEIYPFIHASPFFPTDDTPSGVQFVAQFQGHTLEFMNGEAFIFATYFKDGQLKQFRSEFVALKPMPVSEVYYASDLAEYTFSHNTSKWDSFRQESPSRVRANLTRANEIVTEYIFEEKLSASGKKTIKFTIVVYNLGHTWVSDSIGSIMKDSNLGLVLNYHVPHSFPNGPYVDCSTVQRGPLSTCFSDLVYLENKLNFSTGGFTFVTESKKTVMQYDYTLESSVDGKRLEVAQGDVFFARMLHPIPASALWIERLNAGGGNLTLPTMPLESQSFVFTVVFSSIKYYKNFTYDPDVSITLLFDPARIDATPQEAEAVQTGVVVGIVVGALLGAAAIIAGVTVLAVYVFPFMKARQDSVAPRSEEVVAGDEPQERESRWKSVQPSSK